MRLLSLALAFLAVDNIFSQPAVRWYGGDGDTAAGDTPWLPILEACDMRTDFIRYERFAADNSGISSNAFPRILLVETRSSAPSVYWILGRQDSHGVNGHTWVLGDVIFQKISADRGVVLQRIAVSSGELALSDLSLQLEMRHCQLRELSA